MSSDTFIGLGSNRGEPRRQIEQALENLRERAVAIETLSSLYATEPVDAPPRPWFLNAVAGVRSPVGPHDLLALCREIERAQGRERALPGAPRTIDLDLLLFGDQVLDEKGLVLPHPRLHLRRFVLIPLAEIAPDVRHPLLGATVRELLERCPDRSRVTLQDRLTLSG